MLRAVLRADGRRRAARKADDRSARRGETMAASPRGAGEVKPAQALEGKVGRSLTTRWISVQKGLQQRLLIPAEVSPLHTKHRCYLGDWDTISEIASFGRI